MHASCRKNSHLKGVLFLSESFMHAKNFCLLTIYFYIIMFDYNYTSVPHSIYESLADVH